MPVCYALRKRGRLRKEVYEFHLLHSDSPHFLRNVPGSRPRDIVRVVMATFPRLNRKIRAPRVNLWGTASATIKLQNGRELWAKTLRISITGGLLELATYLDEGVTVSLTLHLGTRTVRGKAATLFPMLATQGYLQPFRFTDLRDEDCRTLETEVRELLKQATSLPPGHRAFGPPRFVPESS
jgi:hypothetical protein